MQLIPFALALLLSALLALPALAQEPSGHGGRFVEVQGHRFELVVEPEARGTHLDFFISDPQAKPVTTATVRLQITGPGGEKTMLPLKYEGGHYTAVLPASPKGEYKVVALASIGGKKLNSRFAFKL